MRQPGCKQEALQQKPFRDKAIEWGQAGRSEDADQRQPGDPRHAMDQTAELAQIALTRGVQYRPRAQEKQDAAATKASPAPRTAKKALSPKTPKAVPGAQKRPAKKPAKQPA